MVIDDFSKSRSLGKAGRKSSINTPFTYVLTYYGLNDSGGNFCLTQKWVSTSVEGIEKVMWTNFQMTNSKNVPRAIF